MSSSSTFLLLRIGLAGLLGLPVILITVVISPLMILLSIPSVLLLLYKTNITNTTADDGAGRNKKYHIIITGGSSGIGLSIARECVTSRKDVSRITLLARNQSNLQTAKDELEALNTAKTVSIEILSVDVSDAVAVQTAAKEIFAKNEDSSSGSVYLFCCAGYAYPTRFADIQPPGTATTAGTVNTDIFEKQIRVNQLGCIYTVHAFLPYISCGTITLTSSMAGLVGVYGYTTYSPTKYALRGFAEALHIELRQQKPNVHIQVAFPPDTDTPGLQTENETKPVETQLVSETAGLADPNKIAKTMLLEATCANPNFFVYFNLDGFMLSAVNCGLTPPISSSLFDTLVQVSPLLGLLRMIALFVINDWYRMIMNCNAINTKEDSTKTRKEEEEKTKQQ